MTIRSFLFIGAGLGGMMFPAVAVAASKAASDLQSPQKRQVTVAAAERLSQRKLPAPLPPDFPSPFNPADFDDHVPGAIAGAGTTPGSTAGAGAPRGNMAGGPAAQAAPAQPAAPAGDRETLETLAAQISPSGTFQRGGKPFLAIKGKFFEVGTRFTAAYNNQDYELELVAIDRTTFTLRYRGEETTRPIKPVIK